MHSKHCSGTAAGQFQVFSDCTIHIDWLRSTELAPSCRTTLQVAKNDDTAGKTYLRFPGHTPLLSMDVGHALPILPGL